MVVAPFNRVKILSRASNFASKPEYQKIFPCILSRASAADTDPEVRVQHGVAPSTLERKYTRTLKFWGSFKVTDSATTYLSLCSRQPPLLDTDSRTRDDSEPAEILSIPSTRNYLPHTRMAFYTIDSSASGKPARPACIQHVSSTPKAHLTAITICTDICTHSTCTSRPLPYLSAPQVL